MSRGERKERLEKEGERRERVRIKGREIVVSSEICERVREGERKEKWERIGESWKRERGKRGLREIGEG